MKDVIVWFVLVCVVGLLIMVAEKLFGSAGSFAFVIRIMGGILAFVFFVMFIVSVLKYANLMPAL